MSTTAIDYGRFGESAKPQLQTVVTRLKLDPAQLDKLLGLMRNAEDADNKLAITDDLKTYLESKFGEAAVAVVGAVTRLIRIKVIPVDKQAEVLAIIRAENTSDATSAPADDENLNDEASIGDTAEELAEDFDDDSDDAGTFEEAELAEADVPYVPAAQAAKTAKSSVIGSVLGFVFITVLWRLMLRNLFRFLNWARKGLWYYFAPLRVHEYEGCKYRGMLWCLIAECVRLEKYAFAWMATLFILIGVVMGTLI